MKDIADVTILCANYNNGRYLDDFLNSIIESTYLVKEIVIVDDCSTDDSLAIIEKYLDKLDNLKIIKLDTNVGFANALNEGIKYVTSKYVLRVDPDDLIATDRIEKQYNYIVNNEDIDILGSDICYFYDHISPSNIKSNFPMGHKNIVQRYKDGSHGLVHGSVLLKSELLKENNYRQEYVPAEEYDIFSRLLCQGCKAHNLQDILTYVRIHHKSVSNNMPYSTVEKTFNLREEIWGIKTSKVYVMKEFIARNLYRNSLNKTGLQKYLLLFIISLLKPKSLLERIKRYGKSN